MDLGLVIYIDKLTDIGVNNRACGYRTKLDFVFDYKGPTFFMAFWYYDIRIHLYFPYTVCPKFEFLYLDLTYY